MNWKGRLYYDLKGIELEEEILTNAVLKENTIKKPFKKRS